MGMRSWLSVDALTIFTVALVLLRWMYWAAAGLGDCPDHIDAGVGSEASDLT